MLLQQALPPHDVVFQSRQWESFHPNYPFAKRIILTRHGRSYQLSGLSVILKAEGIERHLKGSFRELRID